MTGAEPHKGHRGVRLSRQGFPASETGKIEWKGADGTTVEGLLYYPIDYQKGQRYPLSRADPWRSAGVR